MSPTIRDLTGQVFGRLTVLRLDGRIRTGAAWICICNCGKEVRLPGTRLTGGKTRSCGCLKFAKRSTSDRSPELNAWYNMRDRCDNKEHQSYANYGGRGIKVCAGWDSSYEYFLADMGRRPTAKHSIDRIDNNAGYDCGHCHDCQSRGITKTNCRWATTKVQTRNRRNNRPLTHNGETRLLVEWAEHLGVKPFILISRLHYGWSIEKTLTEPFGPRRGRVKGEQCGQAKLTEDDVRAIRSSQEPGTVLAKRYGVSKNALYEARSGKGWKHVK